MWSVQSTLWLMCGDDTLGKPKVGGVSQLCEYRHKLEAILITVWPHAAVRGNL